MTPFNVLPFSALAQPDISNVLLVAAKQAQAQGRLPQAQQAWLSLLEREPNSFDALSGMAELAERAGDIEAALHYHGQVAAAHPADARTFFFSGNFFARQYDFARALTHYRRAAELEPTAANVWNNLGNVEKYLGNLKQSTACYARAVECDPDNAALHSNALMALHYDTAVTHEQMLARHQAWAARHAAPHYPSRRAWRNAVEPERPLRIGYVSEGFDGRVLGHFLRNLFPQHDRQQTVTYGYSSTRRADALTAELRAGLDHWREIAALDDNAVAAQVEIDEIDILVDLDGHTPGSRLLVFARKPAPVAITWLGYWNTTGMQTMDYILTDPVTTPQDSPQRFTEDALRLPDTRLLYAPVPYAPEVALLPSAGAEVFTFGSFNRYDKLGPELLDCWAQILRRVPLSRLVIKNTAIAIPQARDALRREFAARGIERERVELRARSPHAQMLAEYGDIDLGLDTFPYNGGLTTCESLWMGVPMVAIEGERMIARQTSSMLRLVGGEGFIAASRDEYVDLAARWAEKREALRDFRATLRERMRASPLCEAARFARNLEAAYRQAWRSYCSGVEKAGKTT